MLHLNCLEEVSNGSGTSSDGTNLGSSSTVGKSGASRATARGSNGRSSRASSRDSGGSSATAVLNSEGGGLSGSVSEGAVVNDITAGAGDGNVGSALNSGGSVVGSSGRSKSKNREHC